jgi:hypothetical protein
MNAARLDARHAALLLLALLAANPCTAVSFFGKHVSSSDDNRRTDNDNDTLGVGFAATERLYAWIKAHQHPDDCASTDTHRGFLFWSPNEFMGIGRQIGVLRDTLLLGIATNRVVVFDAYTSGYVTPSGAADEPYACQTQSLECYMSHYTGCHWRGPDIDSARVLDSWCGEAGVVRVEAAHGTHAKGALWLAAIVQADSRCLEVSYEAGHGLVGGTQFVSDAAIVRRFYDAEYAAWGNAHGRRRDLKPAHVAAVVSCYVYQFSERVHAMHALLTADDDMSQLGRPSTRQHSIPYLAMHLRHGDKGQGCFVSLPTAVATLVRVALNTGVRHVFVMSDDVSALDALVSLFDARAPLHVHIVPTSYFVDVGDVAAVRVLGGGGGESVDAHEDDVDQGALMLASMLIAADAHVYIGEFSSNIDRSIYEMRLAQSLRASVSGSHASPAIVVPPNVGFGGSMWTRCQPWVRGHPCTDSVAKRGMYAGESHNLDYVMGVAVFNRLLYLTPPGTMGEYCDMMAVVDDAYPSARPALGALDTMAHDTPDASDDTLMAWVCAWHANLQSRCEPHCNLAYPDVV